MTNRIRFMTAKIPVTLTVTVLALTHCALLQDPASPAATSLSATSHTQQQYGAENSTPPSAYRVQLTGTAQQRPQTYAEQPAQSTESMLNELRHAHRLAPKNEQLRMRYLLALQEHGTSEQKREGQVRILQLQALKAQRTQQWHNAERYMYQALELAQAQPTLRGQVYRDLARLSLQRGRARSALLQIRTALLDISAKESRAQTLVLQSDILLVLEEFAEAEDSARQALRLSPSNSRAFGNLAIARSRRADAKGTYQALAKAIQHGLPRQMSKAVYLKLARNFHGIKQRAEVVALLNRSWPQSPSEQ